MTMKKALALALCFAMLLIPLTGAFANQTEVTPAPIETEQPQVETQQPEKSEPTQETTPIATQKSADDGAAVVSEESSETQEPDPTQESTPEATQETTPEATQESTPEATQETTPEATQETTPEATQETTPEASVDPSQDPSAEPSVDPSQDPSAEPSVDPSQDPSAEPSVDPSQDPSAEPSVDPSQDPSAEPSVDPSQDPSVEPSVDPSQDPSAEPSVDPSQDPSAEPSVDPTQQPLNPVVLTAGQRYAVVSEQAMSYTAAISGGVAPYHVSFDVTLGGTCVYGETVELAEAGDVSMRYAPDFNGDHVVTVIVTDAAGQTANQSAVMPVADWSVVENEEQWKKSVEDAELTGEWREDILAIARTQLGYAESDVNFEIDENGNRAGYTRYGHMFHNSRAEWCVMFVSFCLKYADITEYEVPYEGNSAILKDKLDYLGAYEENEDRFDPQPGDFVFFNWDEEESDVPQHVAIVEKVSGDTLHYIEGNMNARVQRNECSIYDENIVGYGNLERLMLLAGELDDVVETVAVESTTVATVNNNTNLRAEPTVRSEAISVVDNAGTLLFPTAKMTLECDEIWYQVEYAGVQGYIRADLLTFDVAPELPEMGDQPLISTEIADGMLTLTSPYAAAGDVWQQAQGESWVEVGACATLTVEATVANLTANYRCVRGEEVICATIPMSEELVAWAQGNSVTPEMLIRAMNASSLESLVLEGDQVIYVRTGEALATVDAETGAVIDREYQIVVAYYDAEAGKLREVDAE